MRSEHLDCVVDIRRARHHGEADQVADEARQESAEG
jgi:hypothetical protein